MTRKNLANSAFVSANVVPLVSEINTITANTVSKVNALKADSKARRQEVNVDAVADAREFGPLLHIRDQADLGLPPFPPAVVDLVNEVGAAIKPLEDFLRTLPGESLSFACSTRVPRLTSGALPRLTVLGGLVGGILDSINNNLSSIVTGLGEVIGGLLEVVRQLLGGLLGGLGGVLGGLLEAWD